MVRSACSALIVLQILATDGYRTIPAGELAVQEQPAVRDLRLYRGIIRRYASGDNEAVTDLLSWDVERLGAATLLIDGPRDPTRPWTVEDFRIATTLHTHAAIRSFDHGPGGVALVHLSLAKDHLGRGRSALGVFARHWFLAVSRLLQMHGRHTDAEQFLATGRVFVPSDPLILFESALLQEFFATKWERSGTLSVLSRAPLPGRRMWRADRTRLAEGWFRESLRLLPANTTTRLHLGRILMMRRDNRDAEEQLRAVISSSRDAATNYLAWIFLAGLDERDGRLAPAEASYREAIKAFEHGQAAYIGLSEVLQRLNRGEESRTVLRQLLSEERDARREPWFWYLREPEHVTRERMDLLLKEGRP